MGLLFPWATPVKTRTHFVPYHGQHLFHGHNKFFIFPASFCALFVQDKANGQKEKQKFNNFENMNNYFINIIFFPPISINNDLFI